MYKYKSLNILGHLYIVKNSQIQLNMALLR